MDTRSIAKDHDVGGASSKTSTTCLLTLLG
ncbi:uncharacterized protein G2W53_000863 [Senna tora]|uniref:Uncharacterized protein n=1 Tax=Senna tora TaxID=362788 RepID=A0A834XIN0_9FABA|nr:uncharacterized protein G2W53_000863 [Senna tora]